MQTLLDLAMIWRERTPVQINSSWERCVASEATIAHTNTLIQLSIKAIGQSNRRISQITPISGRCISPRRTTTAMGGPQ